MPGIAPQEAAIDALGFELGQYVASRLVVAEARSEHRLAAEPRHRKGGGCRRAAADDRKVAGAEFVGAVRHRLDRVDLVLRRDADAEHLGGHGRRIGQFTVMPASTMKFCAVQPDASSEARKSAMRATWLASSLIFKAWRSRNSASSSGVRHSFA